jgi:hypothetical protein
MPRPPKIQLNATKTYGIAGKKAIKPTSANPAATEQQPSVINTSRRIRNQGRDWSQEPVVQPTAPTVNTAPA